MSRVSVTVLFIRVIPDIRLCLISGYPVSFENIMYKEIKGGKKKILTEIGSVADPGLFARPDSDP